jgi:type IV pilus assembly protein PilM
MAKNTFSIDINERFTRMADFKIRKKQLALTSMGQIDTTQSFYETMNERISQQQAQAMKQLHKNLKIKTKHVHVVIPDNFTYSQIIEMPKLKEKELVAAIRYQADEFIPMPINDTYLDLQILNEQSKTNKYLVLIIAAAKKIVDHVYKTTELAGFTPETLENELSSLGRLFSELLIIEDGMTLVVNIGNTSTSLYLLEPKNHLIRFSRKIKIGIELFAKYLKVNLNWDEGKIYETLKNIGLQPNNQIDIGKIMTPLLKEMLTEMQKTIVIAKDQYALPVKRIYLTNMNTLINGLNIFIQQQLSIPTENIPIQGILKENIIVQNFGQELSQYVSVISTNYR